MRILKQIAIDMKGFVVGTYKVVKTKLCLTMGMADKCS